MAVPLPTRLIVCCDGTNCKPENNTNVTRLYDSIVAGEKDGFKQTKEYFSGIGADNNSNIDAAFGRHILWKICESWRKICGLRYDANFRGQHPADPEIVLIGFSRGAFTVQCVACLLHDRGVIDLRTVPDLEPRRKRARNWVELEYLARLAEEWTVKRTETFENSTPLPMNTNVVQARATRAARVKVCALFDSVAALDPSLKQTFPGKPQNRKTYAFVDDDVCENTEVTLHTLALLEERNDFRPILARNPLHSQILKQVWFYGGHSDIGGGDGEKSTVIPDITLLWMAQELQQYLLMDIELVLAYCIRL